MRGKEALLNYFRKLLAVNPNWVWTQVQGIPMQGGFLNKWLAQVPVGPKIVNVTGLCIVEFDDAGKICRNEVYFDRSELLAEISDFRRRA